ncbi:TIGR03936 family radical SAM-associated protein [Clostridium sp.]|uniref:TIGR03936 family radical SAM-associated protein n=1 Tax=Clostridium sp. TaxID=1506 RepID=UPI0039F4CA6D
MKMRYLIKYTKGSDIKYVSHLELMRTIQRILRRADLPVAYSKGFNPHIILSIAQPLSVGVYSKGEYMDVEFSEEVDEDYIKREFNENAPAGIKVLDVVKVKDKDGEKKLPQAMAAVEAAKYTLDLRCIDEKNVEEELNKLMKSSEWSIVKRSKKGEKEVNIKPLIKEFKFSIKDSVLHIETLVTAGSKENLSAQLITEYLKGNIDGLDKEAFTYIERIDMFAYKGKKMLPLNEYFN